jgi:integrase/recombinase XerD
MSSSTQEISPLRQRMLDDMRMRKLDPKTQSGYIRAVRRFVKYLGRSPDTATVEDLRNYQRHLVDRDISPVSLNAAITGLRASEVAALKAGDVDSERMTLRVVQGKGHKDRYAMLSPILLERLRVWWRVARAQGKMLDGGWLFPGMNPIDPLSTRQLNRIIHAAAEAAQIDKRVSMHTLLTLFRPPISWNRRKIVASSRCCSATRNSTRRP